MRTQEEMNKLFTDADFNCVGTGGGCLAWLHKLENGDEIYITDEGGMGIPEYGDSAIVGLQSEDGDELAVWFVDTPEEALHVAKWDVLEYYYAQEEEQQ